MRSVIGIVVEDVCWLALLAAVEASGGEPVAMVVFAVSLRP